MSSARDIGRAALTLATVGLLAVGLLAVIHQWTREPIIAAELRAERDALAIVLPPDHYDNDPLTDSITVRAPLWLGSDEALEVLRARRDGQPAALVIHALAADGYAGPIRLLVAVNADGTVSGVRVTRHAETPGLGDRIDAAKSPWINGFSGRSLDNPTLDKWRVRKDRGEFDQFAGATITPRAVVAAVRLVLQYVRAHGDVLYAAKADSALRMSDGPDTLDPRPPPAATPPLMPSTGSTHSP